MLLQIRENQHPHTWIAPATGKLEGVKEPHIHDVICGRGGVSNNHAGNKSWRYLVASRKIEYARAPKRVKMQIAGSIVDAVRRQNPAGRFLAKDDKTGEYKDIGNEKALDKTSQALREGQPDIKNKLKKQEKMNRSYVPPFPLVNGPPARPVLLVPPAMQQLPHQPANATQQQQHQVNGAVPVNIIPPFNQQVLNTNTFTGGTAQTMPYQAPLVNDAAALQMKLSQLPYSPYAAILQKTMNNAQLQQKQADQVGQVAAVPTSPLNKALTGDVKFGKGCEKSTSKDSTSFSALPANVSNGANCNTSRVSMDSSSAVKQNGGCNDAKKTQSKKRNEKGKKNARKLNTSDHVERTKSESIRNDPAYEESMEVVPPTSLKRYVSVESSSSDKTESSSVNGSPMNSRSSQEPFSSVITNLLTVTKQASPFELNKTTNQGKKDVSNKEETSKNDLKGSSTKMVVGGLALPYEAHCISGNKGVNLGIAPPTKEQARPDRSREVATKLLPDEYGSETMLKRPTEKKKIATKHQVGEERKYDAGNHDVTFSHQKHLYSPSTSSEVNHSPHDSVERGKERSSAKDSKSAKVNCNHAKRMKKTVGTYNQSDNNTLRCISSMSSSDESTATYHTPATKTAANSEFNLDDEPVRIVGDQLSSLTAVNVNASSKCMMTSSLTEMFLFKQKLPPPNNKASPYMDSANNVGTDAELKSAMAIKGHVEPIKSEKSKDQVHDKEMKTTASKKRKKYAEKEEFKESNGALQIPNVKKGIKRTKKCTSASMPSPDLVMSDASARNSENVNPSFSRMNEQRAIEQNNSLSLDNISSSQAAMLADALGKAASRAFLASLTTYQSLNSQVSVSPFTIADNVALEAHRSASSIILPLICMDANESGFYPKMQEQNYAIPPVNGLVGGLMNNTNNEVVSKN